MDRHAATRRLRWLAGSVGVQVARAHSHMLRHTFVTTMQGRGVASDATFREKRQDTRPALHLPQPSRRAGRIRQQSGDDLRCQHPVVSTQTMLQPLLLHPATRMMRQMQRKARRRGGMHYRPLVGLRYSAWLVNRSLPVPRTAPAPRCCSPGPATPPSGPSSATPAPDPRPSHATSPPPTQPPGVGVRNRLRDATGYEVAHSGQTRYLTVILIVVVALDGAASPTREATRRSTRAGGLFRAWCAS
jgi:hypothetical protein